MGTHARALEVVGPFRGSSGYDRHTREFVREFERQGVRVGLSPDVGWSLELPPEARDPWFDRLPPAVPADTVLHFVMPNRARPRPARRNVNYTMFEAERIPPAWVELARAHELIVVPTQACREAWVGSGVPDHRVRVSPLGVRPEQFLAPAPPLHLLNPKGRAVADYAHRFLNVAELRPRKNHLGLLRVWIEATRPDDDAVLIVKGSVYQARAIPQFVADVTEMQRRLGRTLEECAPVLFLMGTLPDAQLQSLYRTATHYISLSHGEGWDQVMMEAALSGLQLIAPRHTAYAEYLDDEHAELLPSTVVPATFEGAMGAEDRMFFDGLRWWQPDEAAAAEAIRRIVDGRAPRKASPALRLAERYSWERAAARLLETLELAA